MILCMTNVAQSSSRYLLVISHHRWSHWWLVFLWYLSTQWSKLNNMGVRSNFLPVQTSSSPQQSSLYLALSNWLTRQGSKFLAGYFCSPKGESRVTRNGLSPSEWPASTRRVTRPLTPTVSSSCCPKGSMPYLPGTQSNCLVTKGRQSNKKAPEQHRDITYTFSVARVTPKTSFTHSHAGQINLPVMTYEWQKTDRTFHARFLQAQFLNILFITFLR